MAEASPALSVVIPSYQPPPEHLAALYESLLRQTLRDFEVVVVDDASPAADYGLFQDARFRVCRQETNRGPAAARNAGAALARSDKLFFTDTDCTLGPDTLALACDALDRDGIVTGNTVTRTETVFGRAVALLGFPGGGAIGFDQVWRVDDQGRTRSFSSCNLAIRRDLFEALGRFNETFPVAGGEDTVLARHAADRGHVIRYRPEQIVYHVEKTGLRSFLHWQRVRGRGNYHIRRHVPEVGGYLRLRLWTFANSFRAAGWKMAPLVAVLLVLSVLFQIIGYRQEKRRLLRGAGDGGGMPRD